MQDLHAEVTAAAAAWIDAPESATSTRAYLKQLVQVVQARCLDFHRPCFCHLLHPTSSYCHNINAKLFGWTHMSLVHLTQCTPAVS